tara:strand:+ start:354 stop:479 length:126 start_codon:yes stop_codon:yes gene_type:complete
VVQLILVVEVVVMVDQVDQELQVLEVQVLLFLECQDLHAQL